MIYLFDLFVLQENPGYKENINDIEVGKWHFLYDLLLYGMITLMEKAFY